MPGNTMEQPHLIGWRVEVGVDCGWEHLPSLWIPVFAQLEPFFDLLTCATEAEAIETH